ncbi:hypothetical protein SPRG_00641 [Saprolegnia parasitica CBS 223.65]|uniref:Uncharacterized protein n=1 Tax=Saprolegnia parasitica (strain CBS 223.65) TaxID=695850 RepID=A0A067CVP1_SAPPC|nr:hypothetical protein SPRG_00641 [Saprolegnia parasitica CBS 223.65]KDO34578.1 hypothetical protein SPRG_00641 [Saprolegnia parasitica CBS 223.65]|eukprot:XP_012194255.1 hypothetical protein SPRG_00641 [Saprolegnia parasitica CBS 223.65]
MAADYDPHTKQWMREAMMSRDIIGDLEVVNAKLRADLDRKLQSAIDARLHPPKDTYRISPLTVSPRKKDGRSDELVFGGGSNKLHYHNKISKPDDA